VAESDTEKAERRGRIFRERVAAHDAAVPGCSQMWAAFEAHLLRFGGSAAVPPTDPDPLIKTFRERGKVQESASVIMAPGAENACHTNAVNLWRTGQSTAIGTGYALSDDGLRREHSWCWDADDRLVEATTPRDCYFGIRIEGSAAERFAEWISPTGRPD
jgi:hypothetical protein